ncbi:MAG: alpha/beta hydrolase [Actinomycetota bacterium]|nr:alpha/beta hydrolase [Actinomycetota bacterium]
MQISVAELVFDVTVDGPEDGRPVLLLHGFPETGRSWDAVRENLVRAGHRVIVPDQRGYSPGARPDGVAAYGMRPIVADAIGILDALDLSTVDIVGHDWGANAAWCLATWHPDRVRSLTAVSVPHPLAFSWAFRNDSDQQERSSYIVLFWQEGKAEQVLLEDGARRLRRMLTGLPADAIEHYVAVQSEPGALTATLNWYRAMRRQEVADLPPVAVPTTYVWSTADLAVGQAAAQKCGEFVDATYRFVILDGVSHWIPEHAPDQLTAAILDQIAAA